MFETLLHNTLEDRDNPDYVENYGPFPVDNIEKSYLGSGYYFWDNHFELAEWWGRVWCGNKYIICKADFRIEKRYFFDLLGSRADQIYFMSLIKELGASDLCIGAIIQLLKDLQKNPHKRGIFPYKAIRAVELQENSYLPTLIKFVEEKQGITNLSPQIIICLGEKDPEILSGYKIIFPEEYVN